jgi:predicted permease
MRVRDLILRLRALVARRRVERELDEELAFHLERDAQRHIANGLSPEDAHARALARFGPVALVAEQCRDARGTAYVDDLVRDIQYAFRTFHRAPLAALTIVATVGLGLGLVAAVFAFYSMIFLRVDAVRSPRELFAVERATGPGDDDSLPLTRPEYEALRRETSVFTDAVAVLRQVGARMEGRSMSAALITGNFFNVLGVQAARGRPLTPADDERSAGQPAIVLSYVAWDRKFAGDPAVIGRSVHINGLVYEIVGVMPKGFRGLQIGAPDFWAPLALAGQFRDAYAGEVDRIPLEVIGRLKPGMSPDSAKAALTVWASGQIPLRPSASRAEALGGGGNATGRPPSIQLTPRQGTLDVALVQSLVAFSPLFFAFGLILMIGCANVANLLLARGISRQREIGIRLSLGASRQRIVRQLLTESLLLAFAAAACGLVVSRLFVAGVLHVATTTLPAGMLEAELARFVPPVDWRVMVFLLVGAIASTVIFGLAPALQATRLELVRTMRGEVTRDARPGRARHALIAVQVGASALLLISAVIFLRGTFAAATKPPGVRTIDTVRVSVPNEPRRAAVLQAVRAHPLVAVVAASSVPRRGVVDTSVGGAPVRRGPGEGGEASSRLPVGHLAVSSDYFDVLGIEVVSGRTFTPAERTAEAGVVIVSETIARRLWPNGNGVGQLVRFDAPPSTSPAAQSPLSADARSAKLESRTLTVVGIVRDPGRDGGASYLDTFRGVYLPTGPESPGTWLMLRVRGNPDQASQALLERLTSIDPALDNIITLQMIAGLQTSILQILFWLTVILGGLALVLTVSGLFSVLSYLVEQQAKEIGVRMALGATTRDVVGLVLSQSLRPVGFGLVAGAVLAAAVAIVLLAAPDGSEISAWVNVFDPVAYAASLLVIVTSCVTAAAVPALRAARIDPIATLRND